MKAGRAPRGRTETSEADHAAYTAANDAVICKPAAPVSAAHSFVDSHFRSRYLKRPNPAPAPPAIHGPLRPCGRALTCRLEQHGRKRPGSRAARRKAEIRVATAIVPRLAEELSGDARQTPTARKTTRAQRPGRSRIQRARPDLVHGDMGRPLCRTQCPPLLRLRRTFPHDEWQSSERRGRPR